MPLLPVDVPELLHETLRASKRPEDGLLHASTDLLGSLRHAQLRIAGAPTKDSGFVSDVVLQTGTLWHQYMGQVLEGAGVPVVRELRVTPWLPEGWAGTADYLFWDPETQAWVLADLKTTRGESMQYLLREGAKEEHIWQLSAYWHALASAGFELVEGFSIIYLPKNDSGDGVEPFVAECQPIDIDLLRDVMNEKWEAVVGYINEGEELAPPMERVQKLWWNNKTNVFDVRLVPHWTAQYCPYDDSLCDCSSQGTTKIGHWGWELDQCRDCLVSDGLNEIPKEWANSCSDCYQARVYVPRKGYEDIEPLVEPTEREWTKRKSE